MTDHPAEEIFDWHENVAVDGATTPSGSSNRWAPGWYTATPTSTGC
ncbi:hypothetical protein [Pseudonocardia sp. GCM10023141]